MFGVTLDSASPTSVNAGGIGTATEAVAYELVTGVSVSQDGSYQYVDTGYFACSDDDIAVEEIIVNGDAILGNQDFFDPSQLCSIQITGQELMESD